MKKLRLVSGVMGVITAQAVLAATALAQELGPIDVTGIDSGQNSLIKRIGQVGDAMFTLLITLSVVMILVAAYKYLVAGSDAEKVGSAHKTITWAAVAVTVAFLAKGFPSIVRSIFGE